MRKFVQLDSSEYYVEVKEDDEGLGVIIDVFAKHKDELGHLDSFTYWNHEVDEQ